MLREQRVEAVCGNAVQALEGIVGGVAARFPDLLRGGGGGGTECRAGKVLIGPPSQVIQGPADVAILFGECLTRLVARDAAACDLRVGRDLLHERVEPRVHGARALVTTRDTRECWTGCVARVSLL